MPADESMLTYESSVGGALMPGERVVWEGRPAPPADRGATRVGVACVVVIIPVMVGVAAGAISGSGLAVVLSVAAALVFSVIVAVGSLQNVSRGKEDLQHTLYRVTDRRAVRSDDRPGKQHQQAELVTLGRVITVRGRRPTVTIDLVPFERVADPTAVLLALLEELARSGRRRKVRRTRVDDAAGSINVPGEGEPVAAGPPTAPQAPLAPLPAEVVIGRDETVLWIGRPRPRDPLGRTWALHKLGLVAWLMIPTALLASSLGVVRWAPRVHWVAGSVGAVWLAAGLYALTVTPFRDARRRARTTYVLTNVRAIIFEAGRAASTQSYFLDMAGQVTLEQRGDGTSELHVGGAHFERLTDGPAVEPLALAAVRAAGTILPVEEQGHVEGGDVMD